MNVVECQDKGVVEHRAVKRCGGLTATLATRLSGAPVPIQECVWLTGLAQLIGEWLQVRADVATLHTKVHVEEIENHPGEHLCQERRFGAVPSQERHEQPGQPAPLSGHGELRQVPTRKPTIAERINSAWPVRCADHVRGHQIAMQQNRR